MYAKGMSQRDIADTIEDIYGFEISHETISEITDSVLEQLEEWQNRPLQKFYTFQFVCERNRTKTWDVRMEIEIRNIRNNIC